jgi:sensitive to high expression protein 9
MTFVPIESRIEGSRVAARAAKLAYENAVSERSQCQREVNDLLQRKSSWSENDVVRFTNLVRQDHLNEQSEAKTKAESALADQSIEQEFQALTRVILNRYHEEQVWSDKIRSASTYGSLLVIGLNLFVFVLAIIVVEPYKRRKMAETFEKRIETLSMETNNAVERIASRIDSHLDKQQILLTNSSAASSLEHDEESGSGKTIHSYATITTIPTEKRDVIMAGAGATAALITCAILAWLRS